MSSAKVIAPSSFTDINLSSLQAAAETIAAVLPVPTPSIRWPLLEKNLRLGPDAGTEVWVKHENHLPTGAFKVRGGVRYFDWLRRTHPDVTGVVAATRGNHGQSVAFAASACGLNSVIVVPHGNNVEKNRTMLAYGAELIESGADFNEAVDVAVELAASRNLHFVASFDWKLVEGVGSYGLELFRQMPPLDRLYVPIGLGSGICGCIAARRALGLELRTEIVGVVAEAAPCYALSFAAGETVETDGVPGTVADGVACRVPNADALAVISEGVTRIVCIDEKSIRAAMKRAASDMHQLTEGAAALPLAGLMKDVAGDPESFLGKRIGLVLSGGNVDADTLIRVLKENG